MTEKVFSIVDAIKSLKPNTKWSIKDELYSEFVWLDENESKPLEQELMDEVTRLQAEYDSNEYQRQRAAEYPSIADQLDTLYHSGLDAWKAQIKTVKDKYPKA